MGMETSHVITQHIVYETDEQIKSHWKLERFTPKTI